MRTVVPIIGASKFRSLVRQRLLQEVVDMGHGVQLTSPENVERVLKARPQDVYVPFILGWRLLAPEESTMLRALCSRYPTAKLLTGAGNFLLNELHDQRDKLCLWYSESSSDREISPTCRKAVSLIYQELSNANLSVSSIATQVAVCDDALEELFHKELGTSVWQYVLQTRTLIARALLASKQYSVYEVANAVGMPNSSSFSRFFKRETGTSPSAIGNS